MLFWYENIYSLSLTLSSLHSNTHSNAIKIIICSKRIEKRRQTAKHSLSIRLNRGFLRLISYYNFGIKLIYVCDIGLRSSMEPSKKGNKKFEIFYQKKEQQQKTASGTLIAIVQFHLTVNALLYFIIYFYRFAFMLVAVLWLFFSTNEKKKKTSDINSNKKS